jgi:hypothetical protein
MEGVIRDVCWALCFYYTISAAEAGTSGGVNEKGGTGSRSNTGKVRMFPGSFGCDGVISHVVYLGDLCYLWHYIGKCIGGSSHLERNMRKEFRDSLQSWTMIALPVLLW